MGNIKVKKDIINQGSAYIVYSTVKNFITKREVMQEEQVVVRR